MLTHVIVTLGWLLVLQSVVSLIWKDTSYHIPLQIFPQSGIRIAQLTLGFNQIANVLVPGALAVLLALFRRLSPLGIAMRATSDNPTASHCAMYITYTSGHRWQPTVPDFVCA